MTSSSRACAILGLLAALSLPSTRAHAAASAALADSCNDCFAVADTCCDRAPHLNDPGAPTSANVIVGTRQPSFPYIACVTVFDLSSPLPSGPEDNDWSAMTRYNGPGGSWNVDSLGTVFGITLDNYGNIFVTHTSTYNGDAIGQVFNAGPGAVYRIDGTTGAITTFIKLPNFPDGSLSPPEDMPGLGNISFDCRHQQFFVTNMEDGKIYRIKAVGVNGPTGTVVQVFDPMAPDNGLPGFAPLGERLWGIQVHGDRLFYGVWAEDLANQLATAVNTVRSVAINGSGAIVPVSDQHELALPVLQSASGWWSAPFTCPVSDISFSAAGHMLLAERSASGPTHSGAHYSRVLEYQCVNFCWQRTNPFDVGECCGRENSAGGVDYDRHAFGGPSSPIGRVWASGDALHLGGSYPDIIYGYQGFRPPGGNILTSMLIDSDGNTTFVDKMYIGDVESPGCPAPTLGSVCGTKFIDANHNGVKDGSEVGAAGWTIVLNGPGGPYTTTTAANGNYCFNNLQPGTYTVGEVAVAGYVQTLPSTGTATFTIVAGQGVNQDFGNYLCSTGGCTSPPPGMSAWWSFNELLTSTTAKDLVHLSPPMNVAQLFSGAAITTGGKVGNAICFPSELAYALVPNANQAGLSFAAQSFSIDSWIRVQAGSSGPRMIVEKRTLVSPSPYRTRGYAVYLNGMQLFLELGIGISTQVIPGPTVTAATWHHFAVTVDRTTGQGRWYLNGVVVSAFNFVPTPGSANTTADLYMGHTSPPFPTGQPFLGCIDELEILGSVLPAVTVQAIYTAGSVGKCPEYSRLPEVTTICKTQTSVTVCFNICNSTTTSQSYHWSLAGLPVGPSCTVAGPVVFSPPAGTVTVAPGGCSTPICVTIPRPAGLTTHNATSCYQLTVVNDATGACNTSKGTIRADYSCWCITALQSDIVAVGQRVSGGTAIGIGIKNPCADFPIPYQVVARWEGGEHPDPLAVRLNGLPPGEPVFGTLSVGPDGNGTVTVYANYERYDAFAPYRIVLEADTDGDGVYERQCATRIVSIPDTTYTTEVPGVGGVQDAVRLQTSPNPFLGGSTVGFSLARPDDVEIGVYDLTGRLVRLLQHGRMNAGVHHVEWDGHEANGHRAPAGVYFVRLESARLRLDAKLVKLR